MKKYNTKNHKQQPQHQSMKVTHWIGYKLFLRLCVSPKVEGRAHMRACFFSPKNSHAPKTATGTQYICPTTYSLGFPKTNVTDIAVTIVH